MMNEKMMDGKTFDKELFKHYLSMELERIRGLYKDSRNEVIERAEKTLKEIYFSVMEQYEPYFEKEEGEKMKRVIGHLNYYIPNYAEELKAEKMIKEIVENHPSFNITDVSRYDFVYGEMRLWGYLNEKRVYITWNYFNGEIILSL